MIFKTLQILFFNILYFILKILEIISNRSILLRFKEFVENKCYLKKNISNKKISFFTPSELIKWRVKTILDKEPETISWINEFKDRSIFWDIGANVGLYSIYAASKEKDQSFFI